MLPALLGRYQGNQLEYMGGGGNIISIGLSALWDTDLQRQRPECLKTSLPGRYIERGRSLGAERGL